MPHASSKATKRPAPTPTRGVALPHNESGTSFLHRLLGEARERFPQALDGCGLPPTSDGLRRDLDALLRFEAARLTSDQRLAIARVIVEAAQSQMRFIDDDGARPLREHLARDAAPLDLTVVTPDDDASPGLTPRLPYQGRVLEGAQLEAQLDDWQQRAIMTDSACQALRALLARDDQGRLDLSGQKFAILGAGAELAPTQLLLEAGADVLWLDVTPPPPQTLADARRSGATLRYPPEGCDLLACPARVARTLTAFAHDQPIHLALYAYAGGASREWRLTAAMNAIVEALDPSLVRSLSVLISPTTVAQTQPEDLEASRRRAATLPRWMRALRRLGLLDASHHHADGVTVGRALVPLQGASYLTAQYVGKRLAAEVWAADGLRDAAGHAHPVTVSANTAGITATRSLDHPLFKAGFRGADAMYIEIFEADTTRWLNGLLTLRDVLDPEAPGAAARRDEDPAARCQALLGQQVHSGIQSLPTGLEKTIRVGALIGLARQPSLLLALLRRARR